MSLCYLRDTTNYGVVYTHEDNRSIGFVDSDYVGDLDIRRSTTSYVFTLGRDAIFWRSMLQLAIALSTTEAEYMAMVECAKEVLRLLYLI